MPETVTLSEELSELELRVHKARNALNEARRSLVESAEKLRHKKIVAVRDEQYWLYADGRVFGRNPAREGSKWSDQIGFGTMWPDDKPLKGLVSHYEITDDGTLKLIIIVEGDSYEYMINAVRFKIEVIDSD